MMCKSGSSWQKRHVTKSHNHCALSSPNLVSKTHLAVLPKEERRIQSACSPDMIGYRQRWLQENRTWLYLSCLSPLYLNGPGECECKVLTPPKSKQHSAPIGMSTDLSAVTRRIRSELVTLTERTCPGVFIL